MCALKYVSMHMYAVNLCYQVVGAMPVLQTSLGIPDIPQRTAFFLPLRPSDAPFPYVPTVAPAPPPPSPPPAPRSDSPPGQNPAVGAATPPGQRCVGVRQLRRVTHPLRRSSIMPPLRSTLNLHANQNHLNTPRSPDKTLWDRRHVMHVCLSFYHLKRLRIRLWLVPAADQLAVLSADSVAGF